VQFPCPACAAPINFNPPKPGRYHPKCPKCGVPFVLAIQINPPATPAVKPPAPPRPVAVAADINGTLPSVAPPADDRTFASGPPQPDGDDRTFASGPPRPDADADPDSTSVVGGDSAANDDLDRTAPTIPEQQAAARPKKVKEPVPDTDDPPDFGGYEVLKQLGKGGMGAVYLARQLSLDRAVALKVMNSEFAADPVFLARFVREAYAAAQLTHHNVVRIYDIGEYDGTSFFSMEFVDGRSLGDLLRDRAAVPPAEAVGYILQAASGLRFAHDRGMVHRDIKPDNLMLNAEGLVKVADLGLVKTRDMSRADDAAPTEGRFATGS